MPRTIFHTITHATDRTTVEDVLRNRMGAGRAAIARAKRANNGITLDGRRARVTEPVRVGQTVGLLIDDEALGYADSNVTPQDGKLDIAYEDEDLIVASKPAGMPLHPGPSHADGTLANIVAGYFAKKGVTCGIHPVQRLDRDTTGLVIFAKSAFVQDRLQDMLHTNEFQRSYMALCDGLLVGSGTIDAPIGCLRQPGMRSIFRVDPDGKPARTRYFARSNIGSATLVQLTLETGRTHQIRIHMSHIGHPLLGDATYGNASALIARPALHSWRIRLAHPLTGQLLEIETPLPKDMAEALESLE